MYLILFLSALSIIGCNQGDQPEQNAKNNQPTASSKKAIKTARPAKKSPVDPKTAAGILNAAPGQKIKIYKSYTTKLTEEEEAIPVVGAVLKEVNDKTYVQSTGDVIWEPYHGPPVAVQVTTYEGLSGWVEAQHFARASKVINVTSNDVLNVRKKRTWKSNIVAKLPPDGQLFFSLADHYAQMGMADCNNEFIQVWTVNGKAGYASCRYFKY